MGEKSLEQLIEEQRKSIKALGRRIERWKKYLTSEENKLDNLQQEYKREEKGYGGLIYIKGDKEH